MIVYRVANKQGEGPYTRHPSNAIALRNRVEKAYPEDNQPGPDADFSYEDLQLTLYTGETWVFGCPSLDAIDKWFGKTLADLEPLGFVVIRFSVPASDVVLSNSGKQLLFNKECAKVLSRRVLTIHPRSDRIQA